MLLSMTRTAFQALTFNINPALLPRWENGPLALGLGAALVSTTVPGAPIGALHLLGLMMLLGLWQAADFSRVVPREWVALGYLLSMGVLLVNVPGVAVAAALAAMGLTEPGPSAGLWSMCALGFIALSLASARPKIRRAFFRDDVRMARLLLTTVSTSSRD
jgi:hypothetical protein